MTNSPPGTTPYLSQFADCDGVDPRRLVDASYMINFEASFDTSLSTPALV